MHLIILKSIVLSLLSKLICNLLLTMPNQRGLACCLLQVVVKCKTKIFVVRD
jgi:hypothetical protein